MLNITQKWSGKMCVLSNQNLSVLKNVQPKMYLKMTCYHVSCYLSLLGDITQKGYEKKRAKVLAPYLTQTQSKDYRNISAYAPSSVHLLFCHIISLSLFFLSRPLTHMIMWLWNIFSGCSSWGGGFNPKSLCTALYCSCIGLQHELLLFYSCKIFRFCWADLSFLCWRDMRWKPKLITSTSHSYLPFSVIIDCVC